MTREELKKRYKVECQPEIMSQMFYEVVDYVCDNFVNDEHKAQLKAKDKEILNLKNEVAFWKDDADKERLGVIIDCLTIDCNKKDEEINLLKQCVEEAIKRPMGVEPSIYSDYKMLKNN